MVVEDGLTDLLHVPLPVPVVEPPPPFSVNVHAPFAVIVPLTVVLVPAQTDAALLVIAATGLVLTVTASEPVRSALIEEQLASVKETNE